GSILYIQPVKYGSVFMSEGDSINISFCVLMVPVTGEQMSSCFPSLMIVIMYSPFLTFSPGDFILTCDRVPVTCCRKSFTPTFTRPSCSINAQVWVLS